MIRWTLGMASAAALALLAAGCGGDEATGAAAGPAKANAPKKAAARPPGGRARKDKGTRLDTYAQIEERFRLPFSERDFASDAGGDDNRDPFRSYVVRQGSNETDSHSTPPTTPTDLCTEMNSRASGNSIRDLRLIGLVLRGTRSYAQFRDPSGFGWIVRLRDCLGKEKAIVDKIGAGFVTLQVVPEAAGANVEPKAESRHVPLHPAELRPEEEIPAAEMQTQTQPQTQQPPPANGA
jgi:hypothetical protein